MLVSAAYIQSKNSTLLAQRSVGPLKGLWEFPGGKIEAGETPQQAIVREIKEELDLDIEAREDLGRFCHRYPFGEVELVLISCSIKNQDQEIISSESHIRIKWITLEKAKKLPLAPLDRKIVDVIWRAYASAT